MSCSKFPLRLSRQFLPLLALALPLTACGSSTAENEAATVGAPPAVAAPDTATPEPITGAPALPSAEREVAPAAEEVPATEEAPAPVPATRPPARRPDKAPEPAGARNVTAPAPDPAGSTATPADQLAAEATALFQKHVNANGQVNYAALKRAPAQLNAVLKTVAGFNAAAATAADRKAFYLNAYNLLVIGEVVARYPLSSVEKVPGFFDKNLVAVAGEQMTLNDLETKKLRQPYQDPRIHFALVCAAKGCPTLSRTAYVGSKLDAQLTAQARRVLQDPQFIRVSDKDNTAQLSQIFKWYADDFKASGKTGISYVNQYRSQAIPASYAVDYYEYNWALNDAAR